MINNELKHLHTGEYDMNKIKDVYLAWDMALAEKPHRDCIDNFQLEELVGISLKAMRIVVYSRKGGTAEQKDMLKNNRYGEFGSTFSEDQEELYKQTNHELTKARNYNLLEKAWRSAATVERAYHRARYNETKFSQESLPSRPHGPFRGYGDYKVDD